MNTIEFFNTVLADRGVYVAYISKGDKTGKKHKQTYHDTIDELYFIGEEAKALQWDAYFALATFHAKGTRRAKDAAFFKSFFMDIDCGAGKPYPSQAEGLRGLIGFCRKLTLPRPIIVSSGRGLHVYWPLIEAVPTEQWQKVAWKLSTRAAQEGFHVDTSITNNPSAVLRMPYTLHCKDTPVLVQIVSDTYTAQDLQFFVDTIGEEVRNKHFVPSDVDPITKSLINNYTSSFKTILAKTRNGTGCPQLLDIISHQEIMDEPRWRASLSIAAFCEEADKAIHLISNKHPQYDPEETEEKASTIKGPYQCDTFERYNPGKCNGCTHKGRIKSPIVLGRMIAEASDEDNVVVDRPTDLPEEFAQTYVIPKYPYPYFRGSKGGVFKRDRRKTADGEEEETEKLIYHNDFYMVKRLSDAQQGECMVMRLHLPQDGVREFTLSNAEASSTEGLRKKLASQGIAVPSIENLKHYVMGWVNHLQAKEKATMMHMQFGWVKHGELRTGFVVGNKEFSPTGIEHSPPSTSTAQYMSYFTKAGTLEEWKKAMRFFTDRSNTEMHKFVIGCSFGAMFMDFSAVRGLAVHTHSAKSGYGKTTAMLAGASIWGDPSRIMMKQTDTHASRFARMEVFKNICMFFDEVTNVTPEDASNYAYAVPQGAQRSRLESDSNKERWQGMPWSTIAVSTGNVKLTDKMRLARTTPNAEMRRVLEIEATKSAKLLKADTDALSHALLTNYGHAYLPFVQYVMKNLEEVESLWAKTRFRLDQEAQLTFEDRFYSAGCTSPLIGLMVAKRLDLIDWDIPEIFKWIVRILRSAADNIESTDMGALELVGQYWAENYANTLSIRSTDEAAEPMLEQIVMPDSNPRVSLLLRYEFDLKRLFIAVGPFRDWCVRRHVAYDALIKALATSSAQAKVITKRMGKGTRMNIPPTRVLMLQHMNAVHEASSAEPHDKP